MEKFIKKGNKYYRINSNGSLTQVTARLSEINTEAAKIMSKYGYKVVKYNNTNPFEGGGGASYFITDPSVIYEHTPFNIPSIPWFPKINLQTNN